MRIGLCGSISVGKTTLVNELAKLPEFQNYKTSIERSKYLRDLGVKLNTDSTIKGQLLFIAERSSELFNENLITDRTIWDVSAFTLSAKSINWFEKEKLVETAMLLRDEYDVVIYVDPEGVEIENNGVRETNSEYRIKIDKVIQELLFQYPPKRLLKIKGSVEDRIAQIKGALFS